MPTGDPDAPHTYHHGNLRRALIQAATELVHEQGINGFTISEAARRAGVSGAAPYRHFADRDAVLAAAAAAGFTALNESLVEYAGMVEGEIADVAAYLEELAARYVAFALRDPARFTIMFAARIDKESSPELLAAAAAVGVSYFALTERTPFRGLSNDEVAGSLWSMSHGVAMLAVHDRLQRHYDSGRDPEALVRSIVGGWVAGRSHGVAPAS